MKLESVVGMYEARCRVAGGRKEARNRFDDRIQCRINNVDTPPFLHLNFSSFAFCLYFIGLGLVKSPEFSRSPQRHEMLTCLGVA